MFCWVLCTLCKLSALWRWHFIGNALQEKATRAQTTRKGNIMWHGEWMNVRLHYFIQDTYALDWIGKNSPRTTKIFSCVVNPRFSKLFSSTFFFFFYLVFQWIFSALCTKNHFSAKFRSIVDSYLFITVQEKRWAKNIKFKKKLKRIFFRPILCTFLLHSINAKVIDRCYSDRFVYAIDK